MIFLLALHSSAEHISGSMLRSYSREDELIALLGAENCEVVGSRDRSTWCESLDELIAKIESAQIVIATDNGILALALALNKWCIALMGPTDWHCMIEQFKPYMTDTRYICLYSDKADSQCKRPCSFQADRGFEVNGKCANGRADCLEELDPNGIATVANRMWIDKVVI
jgi:hypothetical protein